MQNGEEESWLYAGFGGGEGGVLSPGGTVAAGGGGESVLGASWFPTALIQFLVGQFDQVKRVGDLDGVGQHHIEHFAVGTGQIQRGPFDAVPPQQRLLSQPGDRASGGASLDHVEELTGSDIDDLGGPCLTAPPSDPTRLNSNSGLGSAGSASTPDAPRCSTTHDRAMSYRSSTGW